MVMRRTVSNNNRHDFEAEVARVPYGTSGEPFDACWSQYGTKNQEKQNTVKHDEICKKVKKTSERHVLES